MKSQHNFRFLWVPVEKGTNVDVHIFSYTTIQREVLELLRLQYRFADVSIVFQR